MDRQGLSREFVDASANTGREARAASSVRRPVSLWLTTPSQSPLVYRSAILKVPLRLGPSLSALTASQQFRWIAPALTGVTIALLLWFNWGKNHWRTWRMKKGFEAHLTIAAEKKEKGWCHELYVPPYREVSIQIRVQPRFNYTQHRLIFGFSGDPSEKPEPLSVQNTFIVKGKRREQSPDTDENHSIDYNGSYHIQETREIVKPTTYAYGFIVRTRKPGRYPVVLILLTDCGEAVPNTDLFMVVEERMSIGDKLPTEGRMKEGRPPKRASLMNFSVQNFTLAYRASFAEVVTCFDAEAERCPSGPAATCNSEDKSESSASCPAKAHAANGTRDLTGTPPIDLVMAFSLRRPTPC